MGYEAVKKCLENKLFYALTELKLRTQSGSIRDAQRMFGVVLGIRIALMELNRCNGQNAYSFAGYLGIDQLIRDGFGQLKGNSLRSYQFPEF